VRARVTDWAALPLVMHSPDMAALLGISVQTLRRRCAARTMYPAPLTWSRPYVWSRATVQQEIDSGVTALAPSRRPKLARTAHVRPGPPSAPLSARQLVEAANRLTGTMTAERHARPAG